MQQQQQQQHQQHYGTIFILKRSLVEAACFDLVDPSYTFGSSPSCDIRINLPEVKEEHCRITKNSLSQPTLKVLAAGLYIDGIEKAIGDSLVFLTDTTFKIVERTFRFECAPNNTIANESQSNNNNKEEVLLPLPATPKKETPHHIQSLIDSELTASPRVVKSLLSINEENVKAAESENEEENEDSVALEIENIDSFVPVDLSIVADVNDEVLPEVSGGDYSVAIVAEEEEEEKVVNVETEQHEKEVQEPFVDEQQQQQQEKEMQEASVQTLEDSIKEEHINEEPQLVAEEAAIEVKEQAIVEEINKEVKEEDKEEVKIEEDNDVLKEEVKEETNNEKVDEETNNEVAVVEEILKEEEQQQQEQQEDEQEQKEEHEQEEEEEKEEQRTPKVRRTSSRKSASTSHYKPEQKLLQQKNRRQTLSPKKSPLMKRGKGIISGNRNDGHGDDGDVSASQHQIPECLQEVEPNSSSKANNSQQ